MDQYLENLDILFRRTRPELVIENYFGKQELRQHSLPEVHTRAYSDELYKRISAICSPYLTRDEVQLRIDWVHDKLKEYQSSQRFMYGFLCDYSGHMLRIVGNEPVCRMETMRDWNEAGLILGQDLLVTAFLADLDSRQGRDLAKNYSFTWPSVLKTDDSGLNHLLEQGVADNHFHLKGSPQIFPITWVCVMNHPDRIGRVLDTYKGFRSALVPEQVWGAEERIMPWRERLLYAAQLRVLLFKKLYYPSQSLSAHRQFCRFCRNPHVSGLANEIESVRYLYGDRFVQLDKFHTNCLDYAVSSKCYQVDEGDPFRVLTGERNLLYSCFRAHFRGEFTEEESDLLYIYLLLKSSFRRELIQSNYMPGFDNFAIYQDRKDRFFEGIREYETESIRTAVRGQMEESRIRSLEARIMPAKNWKQLEEKVCLLDQQIISSYRSPHGYWEKTERKEEVEMPNCYYVIHFPKSPYRKEEYQRTRLSHKPRNVNCRGESRRKAMALKEFLRKSDRAHRVHGIDACANENGCRPETFATEFRYLRGEEHILTRERWRRNPKNDKPLGVTYHVGEDFIDIVDGLRAVDEAIRFLDLRKGDRIGHGLVLGINVEEYYRDKRGGVTMPRQDLLDNLMWVLYKSSELDIPLETGLYQSMEQKAMELFERIYGSSLAGMMDGYSMGDYFRDYWDSWKLRGDHPDLYRSGKFSEAFGRYTVTGYEHFMKAEGALDVYRREPDISMMVFLYHFDADVKDRGSVIEHVRMTKKVISFLGRIQEAFRNKIAELGLAIECNPTSNVMIGTFHTYENHPIFVFRPIDRSMRQTIPQILASVNTDDLGVFDTSLANEYALVYDALRNNMSLDGSCDESELMNYMEELRRIGFQIAFS